MAEREDKHRGGLSVLLRVQTFHSAGVTTELETSTGSLGGYIAGMMERTPKEERRKQDSGERRIHAGRLDKGVRADVQSQEEEKGRWLVEVLRLVSMSRHACANDKSSWKKE